VGLSVFTVAPKSNRGEAVCFVADQAALAARLSRA
jgi:hypothetical protein